MAIGRHRLRLSRGQRIALLLTAVALAIGVPVVGLSATGQTASAAATERADVGMPFTGKWARWATGVAPPYNDSTSSHPGVHLISGGSDWATDIYGAQGQEVRLRVSSPTGNVSFSWRTTSTGCGTSTGVNVVVDGQPVGWIYFAHLVGAVRGGPITNGMLLGRVGNYGCAPSNHVHVEMKGDPGNAACYQDHGRPGVTVNDGQKLGGLGATGARGPRQACSGSGAPAPTAGGGVPFGHVDTLTRAPGGLRITGWTIDPDTSAPIDAHAYSGNGNPGQGNPGAATRADRDRPDVARAYPGKGAAHGFDVTVAARAAGRQTVCAYGINVGPGPNPQLGCRALDVSPDPYGSLDEARRVPGGIEVSGWAIDPDTGGPIAVHVYGGNGLPGGGPGAPTTANVNRPDVGAVFPNYGGVHGYRVVLPTGPQPQTVCTYGINNGPGSNPQLGCRRI